MRETIGKKTLVNGFSPGEEGLANGIGGLAAQAVAGLKTEVGGVYIYSPDTSDTGEDYVYTVYGEVADGAGCATGKVMVKVESHGRMLFDGPLTPLPSDDAVRDPDE